jgi:asparagine synthase (glutamine-hydrolysing)
MMYRELVTFWSPQSVVLGAIEPTTALTDDSQQAKIQDLIRRMMFMDMVTYLPDDILTKVDRASMAVSLEARVPLLDHRIYEFVCKLPTDINVRNGQGKWPLRQILYKYVPKLLVDRPKMGFGVPISAWLRGPLRNWAEDLLDNSRMEQQGFFNPYVVRQKWREHISGTHNWASQLWAILMFQAWLEAQYGEL